MKKTIATFLILGSLIYLLWGKLSLGQSLFSSDVVPVIDVEAIRNLDRITNISGSILILVVEELQKLNMEIARVLDNQIKKQITDILTDALKEMTYQEYIAELQNIVEKNKIKSLDDIQEDLEEAKVAGAYLGLEEFRKNVFCFNPRIRERILDYAANLVSELDLSNTSREILSEIPDCLDYFLSSPSSLEFSSNFFSPFNLGSFVAQVKPPEYSSEISEINIVPAFQETEDSIEFNEIKSHLDNLVFGKITEKVEERKNELGNIRPLYENCLNYSYTDSGKAICLDKEVVINLANLEKTLRNIENPLQQNFEEENIYIQLASSRNIFTKLGMTTSSLELNESLFYSTSTIKEIINESCSDYLKNYLNNNRFNTSTHSQLATTYARCLKIFTDKLKKLAKIQKTKLENFRKEFRQVNNNLASLKKEFEDLEPDLKNCPGAYERVKEISMILGKKTSFYDDLLFITDEYLTQINFIIREVQNNLDKAENLISKIFTTNYQVFSLLNNVFEIVQKGFSLFGVNVNFTSIQNILREVNNLQPEVLVLVNQFINSFNDLLDGISGVTYSFNFFYSSLNDINTSRTTTLNDFYKIQEINQELQAYKRLVESNKCKIFQENLSAQQKPKVIVVESKDKKNFKFSWFKNLLSARLVEINFKR